jgi:hypothetical protein
LDWERGAFMGLSNKVNACLHQPSSEPHSHGIEYGRAHPCPKRRMEDRRHATPANIYNMAMSIAFLSAQHRLFILLRIFFRRLSIVFQRYDLSISSHGCYLKTSHNSAQLLTRPSIRLSGPHSSSFYLCGYFRKAKIISTEA